MFFFERQKIHWGNESVAQMRNENLKTYLVICANRCKSQSFAQWCKCVCVFLTVYILQLRNAEFIFIFPLGRWHSVRNWSAHISSTAPHTYPSPSGCALWAACPSSGSSSSASRSLVWASHLLQVVQVNPTSMFPCCVTTICQKMRWHSRN